MPGIDRCVVRPAERGDRNAIFDLARAFATSFDVTRAGFDRSFDVLVTSKDAALLVAELGDEPTVRGYVLAFRHPAFFADGPVVWVEEIMADPARRRIGVGRALMAAVDRWAVSVGARQIASATRRAAPFSTALGYDDSAIYFRRVLG
jgi:GNAT superfamily N-acetyltransferase